MSDRWLLGAGVVAGPLFLAVVAVQLITRDGFDITHHPISLLSRTDVGWIQIANFVLTGVLVLAVSAGLARTMRSGIGRRWAPRALAVMGVALIAGGVFVSDPGLGYPPGTPDSVPDQLSWHGTVHSVSPPLAFTALMVATIILSRRFRASGDATWTWYSAGSGLLAFVIPTIPHDDSVSWRILVGLVIGFLWLTALALRLRISSSANNAAELAPASTGGRS